MKLYYTPPPSECFDELKAKATALWLTMGDEPSYSREKISRIDPLKNGGDNFMCIVAMFDINNQRKLASMLTPDTQKEICDRMIDGGQPDELNPFIPDGE